MTVPSDVLAHWSRFAHATPQAFGTGLINKTFLVEAHGEKAVFQRLHPVFAGSVNEDIEAVTQHLARKGLVTPLVLRTDAGALFIDDSETQRPWRALSWVPGRSFDKVRAPALAFEGAALVARFHAAVGDLQWSYRHVRPGVHDAARHMQTLHDALRAHRDHRLFAQVELVATAILDAAGALPDFSSLPLRHCHGDLKISNLMFDDDGKGICLVDLDTLGRMCLAHELGDALRSWTNPAGEDVTDATVDEEIFAAAVQGYASVRAAVPSVEERACMVSGTAAICVELAARFCADALNESYFGWNDRLYASRGEHNLVRARGQLALGRSVLQAQGRLEALVQRAFLG